MSDFKVNAKSGGYAKKVHVTRKKCKSYDNVNSRETKVVLSKYALDIFMAQGHKKRLAHDGCYIKGRIYCHDVSELSYTKFAQECTFFRWQKVTGLN